MAALRVAQPQGAPADRRSAITGTTALPPMAAGSQGSPQHFVGEIESVGKAGKTANSESSSDGGRRKRETGIFGDYAGLSAGSTDNSSPLSAADSPPRLVPLTPVPRRVGASSDRQKQPAAARSNTTTSRESRQSVGTALSSNVPPSLFGSDKSTFDTPLLSRLPAITVPSGVPSLYTINSTVSGPEKHERGKSVDIQQHILESVRSAVASPVSIGGHKKQSLVTDPRTASNELLAGLQQVKVASPEIRSTPGSRASSDKSSSPIPAHVSTAKVLESPAANLPAATTAADRRDWARQRPNSRPPLATASDSSSSRPSAAAWEKKLRERAELAASTVQLSNLEVRPVVVASPAECHAAKDLGRLAVRDTCEALRQGATRFGNVDGDATG
ncbi:hypothetical protein DL89DRAFT_58483 [Linderina pennispora]|uniref:Uncharacterized protein n=1 Tax=Linderina pennispora TaxID=61395 RepID=A0A1Y1VZJ8_9FUNG|nr:uncharacterized protein DL89DRAFT_58483 [Linderina pennispora]ORX66697.1 hypothetical protein DL89DRAFT_58483 [Linderina pennispora]